MNASLKSALESHRGATRGSLHEMKQIKSKITALQDRHQKLLILRQQDIASLIASLDLAHIDDQTLIGGLMFLKDKIVVKDPMTEDWRNAGERFLRKIKPKRQSTSKPIAPPSSPNQPPQKQPQSREK